MVLKHFFAKGIATFIDGPANLLNNDPKNPPDWVIFKVWAFESFKSVDTLLLNAFLCFVFSLVVSNNSCEKSFPLTIFEFIVRAVLVSSGQQFLVFSVEYLII